MMDIVKLLRDVAEILPGDEYNSWAEDLFSAAAELEGDAEPDYWGAVTEDGHIELGMREPTTDDDGAKWCARTEVNQHINDRMLEHPGLRLHLEPLYLRPPTERAVPEGYALAIRLCEAVLASDFGNVTALDIDGYGNWFDARDKMLSMLAAAPGAGGE